MNNPVKNMPITGCDGYYINPDTYVVYDKTMGEVPNQEDAVEIAIGNNVTKFPKAMLAWCALHKVSPFEISDDYTFYFKNGKPAKVKTTTITGSKNKRDADFWKNVKAWAEKQGFYNPQKFIEAMHTFIQNNKVCLKESDQYCVFKSSERKIDDFGQLQTVTLSKDAYDYIKNYAMKAKMTETDYIQKCYKWMAYAETASHDLANEIQTVADKNGMTPWEYLISMYIKNVKDEKEIKEMPTKQINEIQQQYLETCRKLSELKKEIICMRDDEISKMNENNAYQNILPESWRIFEIGILYKGDKDDENLIEDKGVEIGLRRTENSTHVVEMILNTDSIVTTNDLTAILKDAEQRLLCANNCPAKYLSEKKKDDVEDEEICKAFTDFEDKDDKVNVTLPSLTPAFKKVNKILESLGILNLTNEKPLSNADKLYNEGCKYQMAKENLKAEKSFLMASEEYKKDSSLSLHELQQNLAQVQNNLGILYLDTGEFNKAEKYLLEALKNKIHLDNMNTETYLEEVAITQTNLGVLYNDMNQYYKSKIHFLKALDNYKGLFDDNPEKFRAKLAETFNNLAYVNLYIKELDIALVSIENAIRVMPTEAKFYDTKGEILYYKDDALKAKDMWLKVLNLDPHFYEKNDSDLQKLLIEKNLVDKKD